LLDRDRRRQAFDQIDVGFFHQLQKLPRVSRQRFDVAPLAFGIKRVEGERGFAGAGKSGDDDQLLPRQVEADAGCSGTTFGRCSGMMAFCLFVLLQRWRRRAKSARPNLLIYPSLMSFPTLLFHPQSYALICHARR
jgi:hypothetical protein